MYRYPKTSLVTVGSLTAIGAAHYMDPEGSTAEHHESAMGSLGSLFESLTPSSETTSAVIEKTANLFSEMFLNSTPPSGPESKRVLITLNPTPPGPALLPPGFNDTK